MRWNISLFLLLLVGCKADDIDLGPDADGPTTLVDAEAEAEAIAFFEAYQDVSKAVADGYISTADCEFDEDRGAMGIHFMPPAPLATSPSELDIYTQGMLNYVLDDEGKHVLVSVEWLVLDPELELTEPPTVFGVPMDGPFVHPNAPIPTHYDIHGYFWDPHESLYADYYGEYHPTLSLPEWIGDYNRSVRTALDPTTAGNYVETTGACSAGLGVAYRDSTVLEIVGLPEVPQVIWRHDFGDGVEVPVAVQWESDEPATIFGKPFQQEEGRYVFRLWLAGNAAGVFAMGNETIVCP